MAKKKEAAEEQEYQMHTEDFQRDLDCELEKEDYEKRAAQLSEVHQERKSELSRASSLRSEASTLKSQAKQKDSEAKECENEAENLLDDLEDLIRAVNDKIEKRPVDCRKEFDYQNDTIRVIRLDTGEVIEEREMRTSERQKVLGFELKQRKQGGEGYLDKRGRLLFVSDGIGDGKQWGTFYRGETGSLKRFKGKGLDMREKREQAEDDLKKYAEAHGFEYSGEKPKEQPAEEKQDKSCSDNEAA